MSATFNSSWWNFEAADSGLLYENLNGRWDFDPTGVSWTALASIEVSSVGSDVYGYGIIGKDSTGAAVDSWALLLGRGANKQLVAKFNNGMGDVTATLNNPIQLNTRCLVALRYTFVGVGPNNTIEVIYIDDSGLTKDTQVNVTNFTNASFGAGNGFWVGGRAGLNPLGGKLYMGALFNGSVVSDADLIDFHNQVKHPAYTSDRCTWLVDLHQAVGATYIAEHTSFNEIEDPLTMTVTGAPTKGGSSTTPTIAPDPTTSYWQTDYNGDTATLGGLQIPEGSNNGTFGLIPGKEDFTIAAVLRRDDVNPSQYSSVMMVGTWTVAGKNVMMLLLEPDSDIVAGASSDGNVMVTQVGPKVGSDAEANMAAYTYEWAGVGVMNPHVQYRFSRQSGDLSNNQDFPGQIWIPGTAPRLNITTNLGTHTVADPRPGYIYWLAYWKGTLISQADLSDLYRGVKNPIRDFPTPDFYLDFHKAVGATYTPEVGTHLVLNVLGSNNTAYGLGESTVQTDYPPSVDSATPQDATTLRVEFDSPMENNAALLTAGNYTFDNGLTSIGVSRINYNTVDITVDAIITPGNVTADNMEDIFGTGMDGKTAPFIAPSLLSIVSATALDASTIRIVFSGNISSITGLRSPSNYTFSGSQYLAARSVSLVTDRIIDVSVTDTTDITYTVTVPSSLIIGTNTATFTGIDTKYIAEVLIGGDVVWSGKTLAQAEREFDVSDYSGFTDITFRIRRIS